MEARRILSPEQLKLQGQVRESLSDLVGRGEAILLVGSGCSMPMFPSWSQLVENLAELANGCIPDGYVLPDHEEDELEKLQHIVDAVRSHQDDDQCFDRLKQRLMQLFHLNDSGHTRLHELLVRLPFRGYLTTNYDRLLERALGPDFGDRALDAQTAAPLLVGREVRAIANPTQSKKVIHLHGTGERPEGMVLTTQDYRQAYGLAESSGGTAAWTRPRPHAKNLLSALLATRQVVFVGFGLRDPFLMRVLRDVTADWWEWDSPIHYAIMPISEADASHQWEASTKYRSKYGIEVLFYEVRDDHQRALTAALEEIAGRVVARRASPEGIGTPKVSPLHVEEAGGRAGRGEPTQSGGSFEALMRDRIRRNLRGVEEGENAD